MCKIFIISPMPGVDPSETIAWEDYARQGYRRRGAPNSVVIHYQASIHGQTRHAASRDRKRPFAVCWGGNISEPWSYHATFAAAQKAAQKLAQPKP